MGSERQGLSDEYIQLCGKIVRIPMEGACDSLNLAVATGIILYQIYNQRRNIFKSKGQQWLPQLAVKFKANLRIALF